MFNIFFEKLDRVFPLFTKNVQLLVQEVNPEVLRRIHYGNPRWMTVMIEKRLREAKTNGK